VLFQAHSISDGISWGFRSDKAFDAKVDAVAALSSDQATSKWAALDQEAMEQYVAIPWYYTKMAQVQGTNIGGGVADPTQGMPFFPETYLKS
jgi:peptide/nickel transport system substrate-binding protein